MVLHTAFVFAFIDFISRYLHLDEGVSRVGRGGLRFSMMQEAMLAEAQLLVGSPAREALVERSD